MIKFVNAKINIGLYITGMREDGYHTLETIFYPVGLHNGTAKCPSPFCDIIEIIPCEGDDFRLLRSGKVADCPVENDLAYRAALAFRKAVPDCGAYEIRLDKCLPFGAGMGGGSADASFVLKMLNELEGNPLSETMLLEMAASLGADCPFFIINKPCIGRGIGEKLTPVGDFLSGKWLCVVKPPVNMSTREAFENIDCKAAPVKLEDISLYNIKMATNDFETHMAEKFPIVSDIRQEFYASGAIYASMTGSGSAVIGIFDTRAGAESAARKAGACRGFYNAVCLL